MMTQKLISFLLFLTLLPYGGAPSQPTTTTEPDTAAFQLEALPDIPIYPEITEEKLREMGFDEIETDGGKIVGAYGPSGFWEPDTTTYQQELQAFRGNSAEALKDLLPAYQAFTVESSAKIFQNADETPNPVYSPLSMYMTLNMLAQCADGDTQDGILDLLHLDNISKTADAASALWRGLMVNDGDTQLTAANAIWLNNDLVNDTDLNAANIETLQNAFRAKIQSAKFGTNEANDSIKNWMADATNGMISYDPKTSSDAVAMLINTLYYKDKWSDPFEKSSTTSESFTNRDNEIQTVDMMHDARDDYAVVTDSYSMARIKSFNGEIRFILPEEGTDVRALMSDSDVLAGLTNAYAFQAAKEYHIVWSIPKFDVSSNQNLTGTMDALGVKTRTGDYPNLIQHEKLILDKIQQISRIKVNEDGFEASAATIVEAIPMCSLDTQTKEILEMNLNRPFAFIIMSQGIPLFIGCVESVD